MLFFNIHVEVHVQCIWFKKKKNDSLDSFFLLKIPNNRENVHVKIQDLFKRHLHLIAT